MKKITKHQVELIEEIVMAKAGIEKEIREFDDISSKVQMQIENVCSEIDSLWETLNEAIEVEKREEEEEREELRPEEKFDLTKDKKPEIKKTTPQDQIKLAEIILVFERDLKVHLSEHPPMEIHSLDVFFTSLDELKKVIGIDQHVGSPEDQDQSSILFCVEEKQKIYSMANLKYGEWTGDRNITNDIANMDMEIDKLFTQIDKVDYLNKLLDENKRIPF